MGSREEMHHNLVPLAALIGREMRNERMEKPTVRFGSAAQSRKGEDFFLMKTDCQRVPGNPSSTFSVFAVFDGHNGNAAAIYSRDHLLNHVLGAMPRGLGRDEWVQALPRALVAGFVKTDKEFQSTGQTSGTTVTFVIVDGWTVTVASVGDSRCILDTQGGAVSVLTVDHRLEENVEERERVTASGGEVGRLSIYGGAEVGPLRCWPGGLCLSRSIGDMDVGEFIVPIPFVKQVKLSKTGGRLIIASDGIWDALASDAAAKSCHGLPAELAAKQVVKEALRTRGLKDDTTCIVVDIIPPDDTVKPSTPPKRQNKLRALLFRKKSRDSASKLSKKLSAVGLVEELFEEGSAMLAERLGNDDRQVDCPPPTAELASVLYSSPIMAKLLTHFAFMCFASLSLQFSLFLTVRSDEHHQSRRTITLRTTPDDNLQLQQGSSPFRIALFADLHFGEDAWTDWGPRQDVKSVKVMSTVLDIEHPDFVVYLGDVITANNIPIKNASLYWDQAISPTRARGIPWASVFGNHDDAPFEWPLEWFSSPGVPQIRCSANFSYKGGDDCSFRGTTRLELMNDEVERNTLSYSISGPKNLWPSISNYVIKLSSSNDTSTPVAFMYFLDSGGGSYPEVISSAQANWFHHKSQEINPDLRMPEIIFWHIPSKAYKEIAPRFFIRKHCIGSIFKEKVATQEAEMGIMKLLEQRPSVKAVFVGHNHGLDWCCPYKKMWLCFARHSGYGGYGNWPRGARILEITHQPFSLKSWIRMEDGHLHSEVVLI